MIIRRELIDGLLKDNETPQDILAEGGLLKDLTKAVIQRVSRKRNWLPTWVIPNMDAKAQPSGTCAMDTVRKP